MKFWFHGIILASCVVLLSAPLFAQGRSVGPLPPKVTASLDQDRREENCQSVLEISKLQFLDELFPNPGVSVSISEIYTEGRNAREAVREFALSHPSRMTISSIDQILERLRTLEIVSPRGDFRTFDDLLWHYKIDFEAHTIGKDSALLERVIKEMVDVSKKLTSGSEWVSKPHPFQSQWKIIGEKFHLPRKAFGMKIGTEFKPTYRVSIVDEYGNTKLFQEFRTFQEQELRFQQLAEHPLTILGVETAKIVSLFTPLAPVTCALEVADAIVTTGEENPNYFRATAFLVPIAGRSAKVASGFHRATTNLTHPKLASAMQKFSPRTFQYGLSGGIAHEAYWINSGLSSDVEKLMWSGVNGTFRWVGVKDGMPESIQPIFKLVVSQGPMILAGGFAGSRGVIPFLGSKGATAVGATLPLVGMSGMALSDYYREIQFGANPRPFQLGEYVQHHADMAWDSAPYSTLLWLISPFPGGAKLAVHSELADFTEGLDASAQAWRKGNFGDGAMHLLTNALDLIDPTAPIAARIFSQNHEHLTADPRAMVQNLRVIDGRIETNEGERKIIPMPPQKPKEWRQVANGGWMELPQNPIIAQDENHNSKPLNPPKLGRLNDVAWESQNEHRPDAKSKTLDFDLGRLGIHPTGERVLLGFNKSSEVVVLSLKGRDLHSAIQEIQMLEVERTFQGVIYRNGQEKDFYLIKNFPIPNGTIQDVLFLGHGTFNNGFYMGRDQVLLMPKRMELLPEAFRKRNDMRLMAVITDVVNHLKGIQGTGAPLLPKVYEAGQTYAVVEFAGIDALDRYEEKKTASQLKLSHFEAIHTIYERLRKVQIVSTDPQLGNFILHGDRVRLIDPRHMILPQTSETKELIERYSAKWGVDSGLLRENVFENIHEVQRLYDGAHDLVVRNLYVAGAPLAMVVTPFKPFGARKAYEEIFRATNGEESGQRSSYEKYQWFKSEWGLLKEDLKNHLERSGRSKDFDQAKGILESIFVIPDLEINGQQMDDALLEVAVGTRASEIARHFIVQWVSSASRVITKDEIFEEESIENIHVEPYRDRYPLSYSKLRPSLQSLTSDIARALGQNPEETFRKWRDEIYMETKKKHLDLYSDALLQKALDKLLYSRLILLNGRSLDHWIRREKTKEGLPPVRVKVLFENILDRLLETGQVQDLVEKEAPNLLIIPKDKNSLAQFHRGLGYQRVTDTVLRVLFQLDRIFQRQEMMRLITEQRWIVEYREAREISPNLTPGDFLAQKEMGKERVEIESRNLVSQRVIQDLGEMTVEGSVVYIKALEALDPRLLFGNYPPSQQLEFIFPWYERKNIDKAYDIYRNLLKVMKSMDLYPLRVLAEASVDKERNLALEFIRKLERKSRDAGTLYAEYFESLYGISLSRRPPNHPVAPLRSWRGEIFAKDTQMAFLTDASFGHMIYYTRPVHGTEKGFFFVGSHFQARLEDFSTNLHAILHAAKRNDVPYRFTSLDEAGLSEFFHQQKRLRPDKNEVFLPKYASPVQISITKYLRGDHSSSTYSSIQRNSLAALSKKRVRIITRGLNGKSTLRMMNFLEASRHLFGDILCYDFENRVWRPMI